MGNPRFPSRSEMGLVLERLRRKLGGLREGLGFWLVVQVVQAAQASSRGRRNRGNKKRGREGTYKRHPHVRKTTTGHTYAPLFHVKQMPSHSPRRKEMTPVFSSFLSLESTMAQPRVAEVDVAVVVAELAKTFRWGGLARET